MRVAVVSPFLDRQHGTEMCVVEQIERFVSKYGWSIDLYAQQVLQVQGVHAAQTSDPVPGIYWHRISEIPGPHLLKFVWWFIANHFRRSLDRRAGRLRADLLYTPGTNCLDADAIVVHIVFRAFYEQARAELSLRRVPLKMWPRIIHRKLYYHLIMFLERKIYRDPGVTLIAVSGKIAAQLKRYLGRVDAILIPDTVDTSRFTPETRQQRRQELRKAFCYSVQDFVLLLIGNDWKKKGLDNLLLALAGLRDLPVRLLVVGKDDQLLYNAMLRRLGLRHIVSFKTPSPEVVQFYAVADAYVGPSLEDAFNLPILEAMACGLPVIASSQTGASENINDRENGLILPDPHDHKHLADLIRELYTDSPFRSRIAAAAAEFVRTNCSWEQNTSATCQVLETILARRRSSMA